MLTNAQTLRVSKNPKGLDSAGWEAAWAPYDSPTYAEALALLRPDDVVLDIGAGDLRFARLAAGHVRSVIAVERRAELVVGPYPPTLTVVCADALDLAFPDGITVGVLLMRHCTHLREYVDKLRAVGCARLITNARWGMSVEEIDLAAPGVPWPGVPVGWYACLCGATGFVAATPEMIDDAALARVTSVSTCPNCQEPT